MNNHRISSELTGSPSLFDAGDNPLAPSVTANSSIPVLANVECLVMRLPAELHNIIFGFMATRDRPDPGLLRLAQTCASMNLAVRDYIENHEEGINYVDNLRYCTRAYWENWQDDVLNDQGMTRFRLSGGAGTIDMEVELMALNLPGLRGLTISFALDDAIRERLLTGVRKLQGKLVQIFPLEQPGGAQAPDSSPAHLAALLRAIPLGNAAQLSFGGMLSFGRQQPVASQLQAALRVMREHPVVYSLNVQFHIRDERQQRLNTDAVLGGEDFMGLLRDSGPLCDVELNLALDNDFFIKLSAVLHKHRGCGLRRLACVVTKNNLEGIRQLIATVSGLNADAQITGRPPLLLKLRPNSLSGTPPFSLEELEEGTANKIQFSADFYDMLDDSDSNSSSNEGLGECESSDSDSD